MSHFNAFHFHIMTRPSVISLEENSGNHDCTKQLSTIVTINLIEINACLNRQFNQSIQRVIDGQYRTLLSTSLHVQTWSSRLPLSVQKTHSNSFAIEPSNMLHACKIVRDLNLSHFRQLINNGFKGYCHVHLNPDSYAIGRRGKVVLYTHGSYWLVKIHSST